MAKRGNYGRWTEIDLRRAIDTFTKGTMGLNECSRAFEIPKSTLTRHIEKSHKDKKAGTKCFGRNPVFSAKYEELLIRHILLSDRFCALTVNDVRRLAFDIAEKYKLPHNFNKTAKMAGKAWYYGFMKRNAHLSLRQPKSTTRIEARRFNRECVMEFSEALKKIYDKNDLDPSQIFNVDESEFSTFKKKVQRFTMEKNRQCLSTVNCDEPETYTSMVCCVSAAGQYVPPMIIFKRKRFSSELSKGAPPCSITTVSDTGYINSHLFITWLNHFIKYSHPNQDKKILLLLNEHATYSKNLTAISMAKEHGIIILHLPGQTTQRLQPLKILFFTAMTAYYDQIMGKWLESHRSKGVAEKHVAEFLGKSYGLAATVANAINGFKQAGIYPININILCDGDFLSAEALHNMGNIDSIVSSNEEDSGDVSSLTSDSKHLPNISSYCSTMNFLSTLMSEGARSVVYDTDNEKQCEKSNAKDEKIEAFYF